MTMANMGTTSVPRLRGLPVWRGFFRALAAGRPPGAGARARGKGRGKPAKPRKPAKHKPPARDSARAGEVIPARSAGKNPIFLAGCFPGAFGEKVGKAGGAGTVQGSVPWARVPSQRR
jgi:hypothetical protein